MILILKKSIHTFKLQTFHQKIHLLHFQRMRRSNVIDKMLCLEMKDKAIKMLLESTAATDPSDPTFYEYNLRACLVATCQAPRSSSSGTIKTFLL